MGNRVIHLLEKYVGFLLCCLLDLWNKIVSVILPSRKVSSPRKVLFVKFIEQGALVLHRPAFEKAVRIYGVENVYLCTFSSNRQLVFTLDVLAEDNIMALEEKSILAFTFSFFKALQHVRRKKIDTVIDLEFFSRATAIFCYLSGCKNRVGYHRFSGSGTYRGDLFTHKLNYSPYEHVSETGLILLSTLGYDPKVLPSFTARRTLSDSYFEYTPNEERLAYWKTYLEDRYSGKQWIIINPNLNDPLPLRQWAPDNYMGVVNGIRRYYPDAAFIFTGREDEFFKTQSFIELNNVQQVLNLCGKTSMHDLLTLYFVADLMIASDSGPGHFASLTPIHSIILFGPETPQLYGPKGKNTHIVYKGISCSPCFNVFNNRTSDCKNNLCLKSIQPSEVIDLSIQVLNKLHVKKNKYHA